MSARAPRYFAPPRPRILGHRGSAGTHPENTLPSFVAAMEAGATHLELDVHPTADGAVVVLHDDDVDRTTDGRGPVARLSLDEVRRLDAGGGARVPLLSEVLAALPDAPVNVDVKHHAPGFEALVLEALRRAGALERALLASEDAATLRRLRALEPALATSLGAEEVYGFLGALGDRGYRPPGLALQIPERFGDLALVTRETVAYAHEVGLEVHVWTVDDPADMRRLVALGVDGLITNLPAVARQALAGGAA